MSHRDRAFGLSEPGSTTSLLPVHFRGARIVVRRPDHEELSWGRGRRLRSRKKPPWRRSREGLRSIPDFGPEYLIPNRSIRSDHEDCTGVRAAAMDSRRPCRSMTSTRIRQMHRPCSAPDGIASGVCRAKKRQARIVFAEGEDERVFRAPYVLRKAGKRSSLSSGRRGHAPEEVGQ